ncbi:carboxypeptidase-like regulatory domain-containing protein [Galbibacter sp.]|uniref:carboxypeptidase-like regulatory domain-containing protein n=1 Tax=Galbibacter sp. TaxID=2918471 RepID=UPI002BF6AE2E|nr:carboxypeptidase-like regulatory domain-containing protein [Galbibacter sp.]HLV62666.1 carboxypeptidase-like regulatory domain-containing protein [Galbibacter sp.]
MKFLIIVTARLKNLVQRKIKMQGEAMKGRILLLLVLVPLYILGQSSVKGNIVDKDQHPIAYVNIGIVGGKKGTVSDEDGFFELPLSAEELKNPHNILKISCIGYIPQTYSLRNKELYKRGLTIKLEQHITVLDQVILNSDAISEHTVGHDKINSAKQVNFSIDRKENENLGAEIGRRFHLKKGKNTLKSLRFFISENQFEQIKLRINLYDMEDNKPGKRLNHENYILDIQDYKTGWISYDFPRGKSWLTENNIIISLEWIDYKKRDAKENARLAIPITIPKFFNTHYYRYGSQSEWKRFDNMSTSMMLDYRHYN